MRDSSLAAKFPRAGIVVNSLLPVRSPWSNDTVAPRVNTMLRWLAEHLGGYVSEYLPQFNR